MEDCFTVVLESSLNEIYVMDANTLLFLRVNRRARENLGYGWRELRTLSPVDIKPQHTRESFAAILAPLMSGRKNVAAFKTIHQRKDGSAYPVAVRLHRSLYRGQEVLIAIIHDLSERQAARLALEVSEKRFEDLVNGLPIMVWVHDKSGKTQFVNDTYLKFFGISKRLLFSEDWKLLVHPDDQHYLDAFASSLKEQRSFHGEARARAADGSWRWLESFGRPRFDANGQFIEYIGASVDVTERLSIAAKLRASDRRKSEFLAILSHELRNPLAPLLNALELMELVQDEEQLRAARAQARRQVLQLQRLVNDLVDIARIDSGKLVTKKKRIDIREVVQMALETSQPEIEERGHQLHVHIPEQGVSLSADQARLTQVLSNLLINAAKFTPNQGNIWLSCEVHDQRCHLAVRDDGQGISREGVSRIFELFGQLRGRFAEDNKGLGIGLALSKRLVELHGGELAVYSKGPGEGSTFTFWLPLNA